MTSINIIDEVQKNFVDGSYDTNANRAFPDVRDGLKPGQRACLWEMWIKKYTSNKPHVKSAKVSGGVIADLWPHGDTAIYETFARMSQPFINNIPEVEWHGANGNVILGADALAHQRYTECRLAPIVEEGMLRGVDKHNVPMILNFSEDMEWPKVFPAIFPRLLVNGSQGIGVGVSQTWISHSFQDTVTLIQEYLRTGKLNEDEYYPDFPTGGIIINKNELSKINKTGKGRVIVEARYKIENNNINFYEFPYQVYIEPVIEEIKKAIDEERLSGIKSVTNRSDKKRVSLVVECAEDPEKIVEQLFNETNLRKQYNVNQNGIISKTPVLLTLKDVVDVYIQHNVECILKEFIYEYKQTCDRIEILEGLIYAVGNIDEVIAAIRAGKDLTKEFPINEAQAKAILNMRLSKLSKLEEEKLKKEHKEKQEYAEFCLSIIESEDKRKEILSKRLNDLFLKYGDSRRTSVIDKEIIKPKKTKEGKAVVPEDVVVILDNLGYIKNVPLKNYRATKASNRGIIKTLTTDMILLFSDQGRVFRIAAGDIKQCSMKDKGIAVSTLIKLQSNEHIMSIFSMNIDDKHPYITGVTKQGLIKKSDKTIYLGSTRNLNGLKAAGLNENDSYLGFWETNGDYICLLSSDSYVIQFALDEVKPVGKTAKGVIGIKLNDKAYVDNVSIYKEPFKAYPVQKRAGKGKKIKTGEL